MPHSFNIHAEAWPLAGAFRISRGTRKVSDVLMVELGDGTYIGRGECFPYARYGEDIESVQNQLNSVRSEIESGLDRQTLGRVLPPGAARNAVDCALWDLEAKRTNVRVWDLVGLPAPKPVTTVYTLGVDEPAIMGERARENPDRPRLKLKMTGDGADIERVRSIHENAPNARLFVDANEGWSIEQYLEYAPQFKELGVEMIEQPLPSTDDEQLRGVDRPIPVCADESCHDRATLSALVGKYDMINIKLDKTGGLTEALDLRDEALNLGLNIMVGCMIGTSLAMAPGIIVAQDATIVDLDGPLLLAEDRAPGLNFSGSIIHPPEPSLWG
jgi:L-alanine-DL-glutamate epimerase-like enolase superfamily enzyme